MHRAIVVDDEPAAANKLGDLLKGSGKFSAVDIFTNPLKALEQVTKTAYDAAFLDIEMPGIDGLTLAHRIMDIRRGMKIIFVTAYNQYAVEAFELEALDYLLKPVTKERLSVALQRLPELRGSREEARLLLNVYCFGKFRVEGTDGTVMRWRTGKTEELFAYLIECNGSWVAKEKLIEDIWHDYRGDQVAAYFNTCLYNLRRSLSAAGHDRLVMKENHMCRVDMDRVRTDVELFESQLSVDDNEMNEHKLYLMESTFESACEGYLSGNYYDWAEPRRRRLEDACVQQSLRLAAFCAGTGRERRAAALLQRGLALDPSHTELNMALLQVYEKMNELVAARKHYEKYKLAMREEYGLPPAPLLEAFMQRFRRPE